MKGLAPRFVQVVRRCADILAGAAPRHALQYQALIRPDYPRRRVVRQDLILKAGIVRFEKQYNNTAHGAISRPLYCADI